MNHVLQSATANATMGWVVGLATATFIAFFVAWCWWAWNPKHQAEIEAAARLPFETGDDQ